MLPALLLVPVQVEVLGHAPRVWTMLPERSSGSTSRFSRQQPQEGRLVIAHDDADIGAAGKVAAVEAAMVVRHYQRRSESMDEPRPQSE